MAKREFIYDMDVSGNDQYVALLEKYNYDFETVYGKRAQRNIELSLLKIISRHPDFFPAYMELVQFYRQFKDKEKQKKADTYLEISYKMALGMVRNKRKKFPGIMSWGDVGNRQVIRALMGGAVTRWENGNTAEALEVFRGILKSNPGDNPGARFYLLAILEGMSWKDYEKRFEKGEFIDPSINPWFEKNSKKHPKDFVWWEKAIAKME
ncbi:MAG TPA: hypothetical protein VK476_04835 [Flavobacterium sp.]|nr:hypothetical protein [Flavobacterium sp.]